MPATVAFGDRLLYSSECGAFVLVNVAPEKYTLTFTHVLFASKEQVVEVTDRDVVLSVILQNKEKKLEGSVNNVANKIYATRRASGYPNPGLLTADGRGFYLTAGVKW